MKPKDLREMMEVQAILEDRLKTLLADCERMEFKLRTLVNMANILSITLNKDLKRAEQ